MCAVQQSQCIFSKKKKYFKIPFKNGVRGTAEKVATRSKDLCDPLLGVAVAQLPNTDMDETTNTERNNQHEANRKEAVNCIDDERRPACSFSLRSQKTSSHTQRIQWPRNPNGFLLDSRSWI